MCYATIQLSQDGGVSGPTGTIDTTLETAVSDSIEWAETQPGHPWDYILVNVYADVDHSVHAGPFETHQIEHRDGSWECV